MKLRLLILLAAALAAAPAAGQTIKSLGYNTTNGVVPTSLSTNTLRFTNSEGLQFNKLSTPNMVLGTNGLMTFYGTNSGFIFSAGATASQFRDDLGLGATNNVTFSNITASGTLAVTGNVTMSGTDNLAPSQTTNSASSLMTRSLSDVRYLPNFSQFLNGRFYYQTAANWMPTKATNGGTASFVPTGSRWGVNLATNASSASGVRLGRLDRGYNDTAISAWGGAFTAFVYAEIWARTNAICRFVVTQTGTTEGIASYPTNRSVGIEFRGDANLEARLIAHNGTTATNGPWVSFDYGSIVYAYNTLFAVRHLTNGTVELYRGFGAYTNVPSATITGGPTNGSSGGFVHVDYGMENSTNAAVNLGNMQNSVQWWGVEYD